MEFSDMAAKTPRDCFFLSRFAEYFEKLSLSETVKKARLKTKEAEAEFAKLGQIEFTPGGREMGTRFFKAAPMNEKLSELSAALGFPHDGGRETADNYIPSGNMKNALFKLCGGYSEKLREIYSEFGSFYSAEILGYICQIRFLLNAVSLLGKLKENGVPLCGPAFSEERSISVKNGCDIALLLKPGAKIVPNDVSFSEDEKAVFILGANGGGKTTYLRMLGTVLVFFLNGLPAPCEEARIYPFKKLFTHFPADEKFIGEGRLKNELSRLDGILENSDGESVAIFNETFSGTYEDKAVSLCAETARSILKKNSRCVFVTHMRSVYKALGQVPGVLFLETAGNFKIRRITGLPESGMTAILKKYGLGEAQLAARAVKTA